MDLGGRSTNSDSECAAGGKKASVPHDQRQSVWADGDFQRIASAHVLVGELLCRALDVRPGERVLDVAAGTGNASLAAARRGAVVIASDIVPAMLDMAERRAAVEGLALETRVADAQALPFEDASFDVVLSTFGAMFAADQAKTAAELLRVCRPGGRIGMANWTPGGMVGESLRIMRRYLAAPVQAAASTDWGIPRCVRELFGDGIAALRIEIRSSETCAVSAATQVALLREHLPPVRALFTALADDDARSGFAAALADGFERYNRARDGALVAAAEYLEVVAVKA